MLAELLSPRPVASGMQGCNASLCVSRDFVVVGPFGSAATAHWKPQAGAHYIFLVCCAPDLSRTYSSPGFFLLNVTHEPTTCLTLGILHHNLGSTAQPPAHNLLQNGSSSTFAAHRVVVTRFKTSKASIPLAVQYAHSSPSRSRTSDWCAGHMCRPLRFTNGARPQRSIGKR
jgi:hypothetical protein